MPAPARAAGLTTDQIQSILGMLSVFGVDQSTINNVSNVLHNTGSTDTQADTADQDTDQDADQDTTTTGAAAGAPMTALITYPTKGETYDATTATHVGTRILLQWQTRGGSGNTLPAGSLACTWLVAQNGTQYPFPDTGNCLATTQRTGTIQGYTTVGAGKYTPKITIYNAQGVLLASGTGSTFTIALTGRQSQGVSMVLDSGQAYHTSLPTFTGTATVPEVRVQMRPDKLVSEGGGIVVFDSGYIPVVNGRWSTTLVHPLSDGAYYIWLSPRGGDVEESRIIFIDTRAVTAPKTPTTVTSNVASITASPSAVKTNKLVTIKASSGRGCDGTTYIVSFGDGQSVSKPISNRSCNPLISVGHSYRAAGTYTVSLLAPSSCTTAGSCTSGATAVASAQVVVTTTAPAVTCSAGQHVSNGVCVPDATDTDDSGTPVAGSSGTTLAQPAMHGAQCNADHTQVTLSWGTVSGATLYPVRFSAPTNNSSSCPSGWYSALPGECDFDAQSSNMITVPVRPGVAYQWWVHAYSAQGGWSAATKMTMGCAISAAPGSDMVAAAAQFLSDYSDEFNDNLAAVVTAPFDILASTVAYAFAVLGVGR
jgi:hypothetical protein